jgi:hypothetical protein
MNQRLVASMLCLALAGCWRQSGPVSGPGKATIMIGAVIVLVIAGLVVLRECDQGRQPIGLCERT